MPARVRQRAIEPAIEGGWVLMPCYQTRGDTEVRAAFRQGLGVGTMRSSHRFKEPGRSGEPREACYYCGLTRAETKRWPLGRPAEDGCTVARRAGRCCSCGDYAGNSESACPAREDATHCSHWWDGSSGEPSEAEKHV